MDASKFVTQLLNLSNLSGQKEILNSNHSWFMDDSFANDVITILKSEVDRLLRQDMARSLQVTELMFLIASITQNPQHNALALLADGNIKFAGQGLYQEAILSLDQAFEIYELHQQPIYQARVMISKIGALVNLGRYEEAVKAGERAQQILLKHKEWMRLAGLKINLATGIYMRRGKDKESLILLDESAAILNSIGETDHSYFSFIEQNRATSLRHLGQFQAAIEASQKAYQALIQLEQSSGAMRARQNLALTYFVLGRYNESLQILEEVREFFLKDGRQRDGLMAELFISDGLLYLRRFSDVVKTCQDVYERFTERGLTTEVAHALLNLARAHAGLGQDSRLVLDEREKQLASALKTLIKAREIFEKEDNQNMMRLVSVERASVLYHQGHFQESLIAAENSIDFFLQNERLLEEAKARLIAAKVNIQLMNESSATAHLQAARLIADEINLPVLQYQCDELRGDLLLKQNKRSDALAAYEEAIQIVEMLKGRIMVEFRIDFAADHQAVYQKAVSVCLVQEQFAKALDYAERAKSRALLDLLAQRLDLSIQAKQESDIPLVEELHRLRAERDHLYRRLESAEDIRRSDLVPLDPEQLKIYHRVAQYEEEITKLWQRMLIRNADYAREAALWQVHTNEASFTRRYLITRIFYC